MQELQDQEVTIICSMKSFVMILPPFTLNCPGSMNLGARHNMPNPTAASMDNDGKAHYLDWYAMIPRFFMGSKYK